MKNTFGNAVTLTLAGESHGDAITVILDGLSAGIRVDTAEIDRELSRRRPSGASDTMRREADRYSIVSGVFEGYTTGTPICIVIPNENKKSDDYEALRGVARPAHADYAAHCKYHGFEDYRGGGHFSGRVTVGLVAAGAILQSALCGVGITVGTHVAKCAGVCDRRFENLETDISSLKTAAFPILDGEKQAAMMDAIVAAKKDCDSVGGVVETAVLGVPAGVGEPWFDSVEGLLSHALFSLGGIKGVEFGDGFALSDMRGSEANDSFRMEDGKTVTLTNRNGGINGGITNGMPIVFRCAVKPTPSISKTQQSVNFKDGRDIDLSIHGRHDPAIVRRICPVIDSVTALVLCDLLTLRYGEDYLAGEKK